MGLLPCPFCGENDAMILNGPVEDDWCAVSCEKCYARGPSQYSDPHAMASWNTQNRPHPGWQPIETAPKDGTEVIVWRADAGLWIASWLNAACTFEGGEDSDVSGWFDPFYGWHEGDEAPTHWMPLPKPPLTYWS